MRADRLVAVLLLLQRRERVTAAEVATELEVSLRTARRDLEALAVAGLPVYAERGRGGGWRLLGGARTDLSGLSAREAQTLFAVAGPATTASPELRAALRKLVRALPEPMRDAAELAAVSVLHDPVAWGRSTRPRRPPYLDILQAAVADRRELRLGYRDRQGAETERVVAPLGTALKSTVWYLLADTDGGRRTFRIERVTSVTPTGLPARRPPDFDLDAAWAEVVSRVDDLGAPVEVDLLAEPDVVTVLRWVFGRRLAPAGEAAADGRVPMRLRGESVQILTTQLAGFAGRVEVVGPAEVRERLAVVGARLRAVYGDPVSRR